MTCGELPPHGLGLGAAIPVGIAAGRPYIKNEQGFIT